MKKEEYNMEDWLKEKLENGESGLPGDWSDFEQKFERALFFRQLRVGALMSVVLIIISMAFFGGSSFLRFAPADSSENYSNTLYRGTGSNADFSQGVQEESSRLVEGESAAEATDKAESTTKVATMAATSHSIAQSKGASPKSPDEGNTYAQETHTTHEGDENVSAIMLATTGLKTFNTVDNHLATTIVEHGKEDAPTHVDENTEATMPPESTLTLAAKANGSAAGGFSLIPDGKATSNYKENTRPTALMFDLESVSNMSIREPVVPVRLTPSKPKKAYVSPMQEKNPWSYSIKVYPNFTYRKFSVSKEKLPYIHSDFIDQVEASESVGFSLNIGFEASKRIGRITYLNFGAEYISYKTEANFDFVNYRDAVVNTASGEITRYEMRHKPEHIVIVDANRYHYLNFPASISYKPWATDHVRINIEGGASYMHFVSASGKSLDYQTLEVIDLKDRDFRNSIGSIFMKIGATYHVSQQFSLGFEPTVVYFTNTIYTEEYPFEVIPYSMGLNLKLQMKLN